MINIPTDAFRHLPQFATHRRRLLHSHVQQASCLYWPSHCVLVAIKIMMQKSRKTMQGNDAGMIPLIYWRHVTRHQRHDGSTTSSVPTWLIALINM